MILVALNSIFALLFLQFTRRALTKGYRFLRHGLLVIQVEVEANSDYRHDIGARRNISEAGWFVIGGCFWIAAGLVAAAGTVYFSYWVITPLLNAL